LSLILEALKKLEREKAHPDRGFLVLGAAPDRPRRRGWLAIAGLTALAALVGAALWLGRPGPAPATAEVPPDPPADVAEVPSPAAGPAPTPFAAEQVKDAGARAELRRVPEVPAAAATASPAGESPGPAPVAPSDTVERPSPEPSPRALGPPFRLEAISRRDGEPVAILNGRLVREGDRLGTARIVRIGELEVEIEVDGIRSVLAF